MLNQHDDIAEALMEHGIDAWLENHNACAI